MVAAICVNRQVKYKHGNKKRSKKRKEGRGKGEGKNCIRIEEALCL